MNSASVTGVLIALSSTDPGAAAAAHRTLLGHDEDGSDRLVHGNSALRFDDPDSGDARIYLAVDDVDDAVRLLERRGLRIGDGPDRAAQSSPVGVTGSWSAAGAGADDIAGLDHLVFMCARRERALALFGATLGLDFRLDRQIAEHTRQLFFRAGDLVVEVIATDGSGAQVADEVSPGISLWGVAWRSVDIERTHARLTSNGLAVTEIRTGRKPGTRIFTVGEPALATRTVVIGDELIFGPA